MHLKIAYCQFIVPLDLTYATLCFAATIKDDLRERISILFDWLVDPCMAFVRKNCRELVPTSDINLPVSLMNMMWSLMDEFREEKVSRLTGSPSCLALL